MTLTKYVLMGCLCLALPAWADWVKPLEVHKVYGNGGHNAFTALVRFKGALWLAFRSGEAHNSAIGKVMVMRLEDGEDWREVFTFQPAKDSRDPQMVATAEKLYLYSPAMDGKKLDTWLTTTADGKTWSEAVKVYEPQFILWKPCVHDGVFYAAAHRKDESSNGKTREVHFVRSADGVTWTKISTIRGGNWETETTLYFDDKHHATAFLRQKYGKPPGQLLEADPPYASWTGRTEGVPDFGGQSVHAFHGTVYLMSRHVEGGKPGLVIYTYADGRLTPYCQLPAGGDCAYAEAVEEGTHMRVSYYSTHEGATNIYLATVPLK